MNIGARRLVGFGLVAAGMATPGLAQKPSMTDAQVESNVLRALASAPELSTQNIHTTTIYGVVTLSGSALDEASRTRAENLAARAEGVKKVVDELSLGGAASAQTATTPDGGNQGAQLVLQSDGTYAPASPGAGQSNDVQNGQSQDAYTQQPQQPYTQQPQQPYAQQPQQPYPQQSQQPYPQGPYAQGQPYPQPYPQQGQPGYGNPAQQPYPNQYPARRSMYGGPNSQNGYANGAPVPGGQEAGRPVTVPSGAMLRIRISQGLNTKHSSPGEIFDGTVLNDVTSDGAVAIPRGAAIQGIVVDVRDSGALKGRGELALQLTKLTMGGQSYTLTSDIWKEHGSDKTVHTVDSALGLGALGAIIGGVAGGGSGAAIGAGVGAGAGVASSAASPGGKVIIPPEAVLTFHLAQATTVSTVSEQEMSRLSYAAGPGNGQPVVRRRAYPQPYYAPYGPNYGPRY